MKNYSMRILGFGILFLICLSACSKDDDTDDGGGGTNMEVTRMTAQIDGQTITFDTVNASQSATLIFQGKPYVGFVPSLALTIKIGQTVGEHPFAMLGEVEAAQYTGVINGGTHVFIAKSGTLNITEHRVNEYIKGTFSFIGEHTQRTLPDVQVTDGEFEAFY